MTSSVFLTRTAEEGGGVFLGAGESAEDPAEGPAARHRLRDLSRDLRLRKGREAPKLVRGERQVQSTEKCNSRRRREARDSGWTPWEIRGGRYGAYRMNRSARNVRVQIAIAP